jgi:hypothetical protein
MINAIPTWDDPNRVAQLVESDQELIDLMKTVDETRGCSAVHSNWRRLRNRSDRWILPVWLARIPNRRSAGGCRGMAEAIIAKDLARLGALIGQRDAAKIRIDVSRLPLDLPRRPGQPTNLAPRHLGWCWRRATAMPPPFAGSP